jgi:hypothetical protein
MKKIDFHGYTTKQTLDILRHIDKTDHTTKELHLITGKGLHSNRRPQMDYFVEREWKCPLKKTIMDYIIHEKGQGARMFEYPVSIVWRRKLE